MYPAYGTRYNIIFTPQTARALLVALRLATSVNLQATGPTNYPRDNLLQRRRLGLSNKPIRPLFI